MSDDTWQPVHPDMLVGPELDELAAMFGDIDWTDRPAVEHRVAELTAFNRVDP